MLTGQAFAYPCMLSQCVSNVLNALMFRHLTSPPNQCVVRLCNPFLTVYKKACRDTAFSKWPELQNGEWRIGKPLSKLMNIDKSRLFDPVKPHAAKSFAKREVQVLVPTKARLIQGNVNEATAYQHPDEYSIVKEVLKTVGSQAVNFRGTICRMVYAGGLNHAQLSSIVSEAYECGCTIFDERDGKNWDATMNEPLLRAEALVYEMLKLRSASVFLERSAYVHGTVKCLDAYGQQVVKYTTAWKRLSGDWNTSVGNTIISMIIIFTCLSNMPEHLRPTHLTGLFMGDDYLGIMRYPDGVDVCALKSCLNDIECRCGITPVRALFRDPLRVSFCSLTLWPLRAGGYQFVPQPGKQLAKLFWAADSRLRSRLKFYRAAIAHSFWSTYHGFEVMQKFLKHHYGPLSPKIVLNRHIIEPLVSEVADVAWREGFVYKYRIPYDALSFDYPAADGVWHHPAIVHMITVESLDPPDRFGAL